MLVSYFIKSGYPELYQQALERIRTFYVDYVLSKIDQEIDSKTPNLNLVTNLDYMGKNLEGDHDVPVDFASKFYTEEKIDKNPHPDITFQELIHDYIFNAFDFTQDQLNKIALEAIRIFGLATGRKCNESKKLDSQDCLNWLEDQRRIFCGNVPLYHKFDDDYNVMLTLEPPAGSGSENEGNEQRQFKKPKI